MSNETTQKRSLSVSLGAAFLMATSAPTFINQDGKLVTSDIDFQSYNLDHLIYEVRLNA